MTVKYSFAMNDAAISAGIKSIARRSKKLCEDTHKVATSILVAWATDGNANKAKQHANELLKSVDQYAAQAVINWFGVHAKFEWTKDDSFRYTETTITVEQVQAAKAEPYWNLTPPATLKAFDLNEAIKALIKRAEDAQKKANKAAQAGQEVPENHIEPAVLQALRDSLNATTQA